MLLADIVDEEPGPARVRIEGNPPRVAQAPCEGLLALPVGLSPPGQVAAGTLRAGVRVARRYLAVPRDPQDLAQKDVLIAEALLRSAQPLLPA